MLIKINCSTEEKSLSKKFQNYSTRNHHLQKSLALLSSFLYQSIFIIIVIVWDINVDP